jgi:hypothetical protein
MRRKLTTLRAKQGHTQNGASRTLIDLALYAEHRHFTTGSHHWDPQYSGWSNATRPRDMSISLRRRLVEE